MESELGALKVTDIVLQERYGAKLQQVGFWTAIPWS